MNKRTVGNDSEDIVVRYLEKNGINVIDRNYYTKHGEIDIIGTDGEYLVFFEVKYRKSGVYGDPLEAVTYSKQRRIISSAKVYLYMNHYPESTYVRFDCIGVLGEKINWIKNAFSL